MDEELLWRRTIELVWCFIINGIFCSSLLITDFFFWSSKKTKSDPQKAGGVQI